MADYVVEMLVDGEVVAATVEDAPVGVEVFDFLRDTHYYIGPTAPTDPTILVWYDTSAPA